MGKLTISLAIFNSYVRNCQGVRPESEREIVTMGVHKHGMGLTGHCRCTRHQDAVGNPLTGMVRDSWDAAGSEQCSKPGLGFKLKYWLKKRIPIVQDWDTEIINRKHTKHVVHIR